MDCGLCFPKTAVQVSVHSPAHGLINTQASRIDVSYFFLLRNCLFWLAKKVPKLVASALVSFFTRLLGSVVCHREGSALVVTVFLVRIIECFEERFLLVRSILIYLRLGQIANRLVWHWISPSYESETGQLQSQLRSRS